MTLVTVDNEKDYSKEFTIFTDGSALGNSKTSPAGWGVYIPMLKISMSKGMIGTNNQAELEAMRVGLWYFRTNWEEKFKKVLKELGKNEVYFVSDSEYTLKAVCGINSVNANKREIENCKGLIEEIEGLKVSVKMIHVNSHTNKTDFLSVNNAIVDSLASTKAKSMKDKNK